MDTRERKELFSWIVVLFVLGLLFYGIFRKPMSEEARAARLDKLRRDAYNRAVACSETKTPRVKYEDITWVATPGSVLKVEAIDGSIELAGFADIRDNTIYVPETKKYQRWIMTHEVLHLLGYIGHPDHPFKTCRVLPDQN